MVAQEAIAAGVRAAADNVEPVPESCLEKFIVKHHSWRERWRFLVEVVQERLQEMNEEKHKDQEGAAKKPPSAVGKEGNSGEWDD